MNASDRLNTCKSRGSGGSNTRRRPYDKRYLIEANIGFNGSENFAKGKRMGVFPAVAIGWLT